ncbi:MAG: LuxR C-terminal-related transcriptional regulator [Marmoricola sp.]
MGSIEELVRRVEDADRAELSAKALREHVLDALRRVLPFEAHVFTLVDPSTLVATSPHADVPMLPWERLPETIRWRYLTLVNRVDTLAGHPAASLLSATENPSDSLIWERVLREVGVRDTAMVTFADRYGVWGYLELWRTTGPFLGAELEVLTAISGALTAALRSALARTFSEPDPASGRLGPAVVLLNNDLVVQRQTEAAGVALLRLLPPDEPMAPIPAAAYNAAAALIAVEERVPLGEPWSRVHLGGNRWVTVRASRLGPDIAVSIEPSTPAERMELFARAHGLSDRESEVVALLAIGLDTRELAGQLFLSEHTVNDHVKAVLAKTGARTRPVLLARINGG